MISLNSGAVTATGAFYLGQNNKNLRKSLARLSNGFRGKSPAEDPGALSVSMKLKLARKQNEGAMANVNSAVSYLQSQDGALNIADRILTRMSVLATQASSGTISASDRQSYDAEVDSLKDSLGTLFTETFNGMSLFWDSRSATPSTNPPMSVVTDLEDGTESVLSADLGSVTYHVGSSASLGIDLSTDSNARMASESIHSALQNLATLRTSNGSLQSRLAFAINLLEVNRSNLEAANSQNNELDFASEITKNTKHSILEEKNLVLYSQANLRADNAMHLLE